MIEVWQWILLALIALVTVGGFIEASVDKAYRPSVWRWLVALFLPAFWWCGVLYGKPYIIAWKEWRFFPTVLMILFGGPAWFVYSIILWVGWVMCPTNESQAEMPIYPSD